jgi:hypothetical protein
MEIIHITLDVLCIVSLSFLYWKVFQLGKENKKMSNDITTLYGNEKLLVSMFNAIRGRINNLYAKKTKDPSYRRKPIDSDLGDSDDEYQDGV